MLDTHWQSLERRAVHGDDPLEHSRFLQWEPIYGQRQVHYLLVSRRKQRWPPDIELTANLKYWLWLDVRFSCFLTKRNALAVLILQVHEHGMCLVGSRVGNSDDESD